MSDSVSDADKIRNKRLAKLGGASTSQPPSATTPEAEAGSSNSTPNPPTTQDQASPLGRSNTPSSLEGVKPQQKTVSQLGIRSQSSASSRNNVNPSNSPPLKRSRPSPAPIKANAEGQSVPLDLWTHRTLSQIFGVTLDENVKQDYMGNKLQYAKESKEELEQQGLPLKLDTSILDQVILEAASSHGQNKPLDYLLECWRRAFKHFKGLKLKPDEPKMDVIKEAKRLCMSYCVFAITMPDMYGLEPPEQNVLLPYLLMEQDSERAISHEFLSELVLRSTEDDTAQDAIIGAIEDLSRQLARMTMNDNYKPYVNVLRRFILFPSVVNAMVHSPMFLPSTLTAATFEAETLLGPFFHISPLQGDVASNYFSAPSSMEPPAIRNSQNALRMTLRTHQTDLLEIANGIVRTGKEAREIMLDWFAASLNLNHKRRAMRVDKRTVSSDGFMLNVTVCLDHLCEPFMDATFSKLDRIDVNYLRRNPRVDIKEETKLDADQGRSDDFYSQQAEGQSNFISEVFFLTLAAHHYGTEAISSMLSRLEKDLKWMQSELENLENEREKFAQDPIRLGQFKTAVEKYKHQIDKGRSYKYAVEGVVLDDQMQAMSMQFMRYVVVWLLRIVDPEGIFPKRALKLPLPDIHSDIFRCLPEYFLEDVVDNFKFITRNLPEVITTTQSDELVMLCITFLRSSDYIKNPYLKAGLVTILFHGVSPQYGRSKGTLGEILNSLPFALDNLLHALMKFYIEAETTGTHTQFFDKFNIRYEIFQIIKCIWSNQIYRDHLSEESKVNVDFFVRFVNLLLNDVTFVLDESLSSFLKIHELSEQLKNAEDMDAAVKKEKEEALTDAQGRARSYMQLTNETVAMLKLFTDALADPFTMPEIVQRLAAMLNHKLEAMVGPKSSQLKVENAAEYGWKPRELLSDIVDVYLNLASKDNFLMAIAADGRSYNHKNFETATNILRKWYLKSPEVIVSWVDIGNKVQKFKEIEDQAEEDLGEIPDEFLDPLLYTLMEDPVILPTSRTTLDRSTIQSHLLSDPNDPFNRAPLKIEDVIPDTDMKNRIEAFKTEKKAQKKANAMDISEG